MISSPLDLLALSPAMAKRAWWRFVANHEPPAEPIQRKAEFVALALDEWQLNEGSDGEEHSRKNLVERLAKFWAAYKANGAR